MAVRKAQQNANSMLLDKSALRKAVEALNKRLGIEPDPTATAEKAREMMIARGVRPEDREATRELLRMRYGDDYTEE